MAPRCILCTLLFAVDMTDVMVVSLVRRFFWSIFMGRTLWLCVPTVSYVVPAYFMMYCGAAAVRMSRECRRQLQCAC